MSVECRPGCVRADPVIGVGAEAEVSLQLKPVQRMNYAEITLLNKVVEADLAGLIESLRSQHNKAGLRHQQTRPRLLVSCCFPRNNETAFFFSCEPRGRHVLEHKPIRPVPWASQ